MRQIATATAAELATATTLSLCAAVCSAAGAVLAVLVTGVTMTEHRLACSQAAFAAALLFLACCDLLPEAAAGIPPFHTALFFLLGAAGAALTARVLPIRRYAIAATTAPRGIRIGPRTDALVVGLVTFVSLAVHNLLEGVSILLAVHDGLESGARLAFAISLENIPEGVCIAMPLLFATRRRSIAVRMALFAGMMEPLGVLLHGVFLPAYMTQSYISGVLAIIAGILVFVALVHMLPLAVKTVGATTMSSLSVSMGCGVMFAMLFQPLLMYHARVGSVD